MVYHYFPLRTTLTKELYLFPQHIVKVKVRDFMQDSATTGWEWAGWDKAKSVAKCREVSDTTKCQTLRKVSDASEGGAEGPPQIAADLLGQCLRVRKAALGAQPLQHINADQAAV